MSGLNKKFEINQQILLLEYLNVKSMSNTACVLALALNFDSRQIKGTDLG